MWRTPTLTSSLSHTCAHTPNSRDRMTAILGWLDLGWGPLVCALKHSMPRDGHTTSLSALVLPFWKGLTPP